VLAIVIYSVFVGRFGGLNQTSLRKLIIYSSINHLGWLLVASFFGAKYLVTYFFVYCFTNGVLVFVLSYINLFYISQLFYYTPSSLLLIAVYLN
jgi:NADH-ubiquinone oxidoreductase chain 2